MYINVFLLLDFCSCQSEDSLFAGLCENVVPFPPCVCGPVPLFDSCLVCVCTFIASKDTLINIICILAVNSYFHMIVSKELEVNGLPIKLGLTPA